MMIVGVIIILLGILFLIEIFNPSFHLEFDIIWPLIIFFFAIYNIIRNKKCTFFYGFLIFMSFWFLFVNMNLITYPYTRAFWPLTLIIIGAYIIFITLDQKEINEKIRSNQVKGAVKKYMGIFSGVEEKIKTDDFKGADVYCIFGGVDLDLREITLKEDAIINVYSVFGGGTLFVSDRYNVVCNSNAFFGSNTNKVDNTPKKNAKTLTINCISFFGGTEIE